MVGQHVVEDVDDGAQLEQAAVAGDDADEAARQIADAGLPDQLIHRLGLLRAADKRAGDQAAQIVAVVDHRLEPRQVGGHGVELLRLVGEVVERERITPR